MLASVAAGHVKARRWVLTLAPVLTAILMILIFGLAANEAAGSRAATNPAVRVPGLLTATDAGPGWSRTTVGALQAEPQGCFRPRSQLMASSPLSVIGVMLTAPAGLPTVDEVAARFADVRRASAGFESVASNLRSCPTFATAAGAATVVPVPGPLAGVKSAAARVTLGDGAPSAGADFVAFQEGTAVGIVVYGTTGIPDQSAVTRLAAKASARLGP